MEELVLASLILISGVPPLSTRKFTVCGLPAKLVELKEPLKYFKRSIATRSLVCPVARIPGTAVPTSGWVYLPSIGLLAMGVNWVSWVGLQGYSSARPWCNIRQTEVRRTLGSGKKGDRNVQRNRKSLEKSYVVNSYMNSTDGKAEKYICKRSDTMPKVGKMLS